MSYIDFNSILNPIGSIDDKYHNPGKSKGLKQRHFEYSEDNPYMKLINDMLASDNYNADEVADLYKKSYQWEADNSDWARQLEVDQLIKAEQREYDSPLAQVDRYRDAGINIDIMDNGSSVGNGSNGNVQGATMPDNEGKVPYTDAYAGRNFALSAINTAGNFIGSLGSGIGSILNGISNLRTSGSIVRLNDAQSHLVSSQAREVDALLDGKIKSQELSNIDGFLLNSVKFSNILGKDFTDEQAASVFGAAGISELDYGAYSDAVRSIQERPEFITGWYNSKVGERFSKEQERVYDEEYASRMVEVTAESEMDSKISQTYISGMSKKLNEILAMDEMFVKNQASSLLEGAQLDASKVQQAFREFENYCMGYGERIDHANLKLKRIDAELDEYMVDLGIKGLDGKPVRVFKPDLTPAEKAYIDALQDSRMLIKYGSVNDMMMFTNAINDFNMQAYIKGEMLRETGSLKTLNGRQKISQFGEGMFRRSITGVQSGIDIANKAVGTVGNVVSGLLFGGAAVLGKIGGTVATGLYTGSQIGNMTMQTDLYRMGNITAHSGFNY